MGTIFGFPWDPKQAHGAHFQALGLPSLLKQPLPRVWGLPSIFQQPLPRVLGLPGLFEQFVPRVWGLPSIFKQPLSEGCQASTGGGNLWANLQIVSKTDVLGHDSASEKAPRQNMVWPTASSEGVVETQRPVAFLPSLNNPFRRSWALQAPSNNHLSTPLPKGLPSIIQPGGGTCGQITKRLQNGSSRAKFQKRKNTTPKHGLANCVLRRGR